MKNLGTLGFFASLSEGEVIPSVIIETMTTIKATPQ